MTTEQNAHIQKVREMARTASLQDDIKRTVNALIKGRKTQAKKATTISLHLRPQI